MAHWGDEPTTLISTFYQHLLFGLHRLQSFIHSMERLSTFRFMWDWQFYYVCLTQNLRISLITFIDRGSGMAWTAQIFIFHLLNFLFNLICCYCKGLLVWFRAVCIFMTDSWSIWASWFAFILWHDLKLWILPWISFYCLYLDFSESYSAVSYSCHLVVKQVSFHYL